MRSLQTSIVKTVYLDYASTTPVDPQVVASMLPFFSQKFGNPSSFHHKGMEAKNAVDDARSRIASLLGCSPHELFFTSGGTESINFALKGIAFAHKQKGNHIITSTLEHHAVLDTCAYLEKQGFTVTYVPVDAQGRVNPKDVERAITPKTILISIMYANNEIGTIEPISEIGTLAQKQGIYFHSDACQAAGALDLDVRKLHVDLLTINGSKIYGPKGIGLLYARKGIALEPLLHGGGQERGMRSGTENVPYIVGFAKAFELAQSHRDQENKRLTKLRDALISGLLKIDKTRLNGPKSNRLPNNVNISFLDIEGEAMLLYLNEKGICASTGSACASQSLETSHVLRAIGMPYEASHGSLRFSLGKYTTFADIKKVLAVMPSIVKTLRELSPVRLTIKHFQ